MEIVGLCPVLLLNTRKLEKPIDYALLLRRQIQRR